MGKSICNHGSSFKHDSEIPSELKNKIKELSGSMPFPFIIQLLKAWGIIFFSIGVSIHFQVWWLKLLTVIIVATRQNVLGLLVHDQAHKLGIRGQKGDILTNLFAAYPLIFLSVENYSKVHLAHHKYYFTDKDPDHLRKSGQEWRVPKTKYDFFKILLQDISGLNIYKNLKSKNTSTNLAELSRSKPTPPIIKYSFYILVIFLLSYFHLWFLFLLYWILPLLTVAQAIIRWAALTEHYYNSPGAKTEDNSPLIIPTWLDNLILPNLNFSYHAYHHRYPNVSFSRLPMVHKLYLKYNLINEKNVFYGYLEFLRSILL